MARRVLLATRMKPLPAPLASTLVLAFALLGGGCAHDIYSPPAHPIPLEAPRAIGDGQTAIKFGGGTTSALFGPDVLAGTASVHRGMGSGVEVSMEANAMHIDGTSAAGTSPDIVTGRAGGKAELFRHHVAATAGLGGGHSAGGDFVSPDVGLIAGFDNPYVIPFASAHAMGSFPVNERDVDVTPAGEAPGTYVARPKTTWGIGGSAGLRIPIGDADGEGTHGGVNGGMTLWRLYSAGQDEGFMGLGASADVVF